MREGQVICIVEAMKMENEITAHRRGVVTALSVRSGEPVRTGQVICVVTQRAGEAGSAVTGEARASGPASPDEPSGGKA